jgi:hypothetical protein
VILITYLHRVRRLKMCKAIYLFLLYVFMAWGGGEIAFYIFLPKLSTVVFVKMNIFKCF